MIRQLSQTECTQIGWMGRVDGYWGWLLNHFTRVHHLDASGLDSWIAEQHSEKVLCIGLEGRQDPSIDFFNRLVGDHRLETSRPKGRRKQSPTPLSMQWCALLGESWAGHRRTHPLHESIRSFYWYELYDRLLPWLAMERVGESAGAAVKQSRVDGWIHAAEASTSFRAYGTKALVLTEAATAANMWLDILNSMGIFAVDLELSDLRLRMEPELVVLDLDRKPLGSGDDAERIAGWIRRVRSRFPASMLVLADPFPRWSHWQCWFSSGVDVLLPKPFSSLGLQWVIQTWLEMDPQDTIESVQ